MPTPAFPSAPPTEYSSAATSPSRHDDLSQPGPDGTRIWTSTVLQAIGETEASFGPYSFLSEPARAAFLFAVRERLAARAERNAELAFARIKREERWLAIADGERPPLAIHGTEFADLYARQPAQAHAARGRTKVAA